jgi:hypothetical protein
MAVKPTGDLTTDLQTVLKDFPTFGAQWSLGLIYAIITDYTLFALFVLAVLSGWRERSPLFGGVVFFATYAALRAFSLHAEALAQAIAVHAQARFVEPSN